MRRTQAGTAVTVSSRCGTGRTTGCGTGRTVWPLAVAPPSPCTRRLTTQLAAATHWQCVTHTTHTAHTATPYHTHSVIHYSPACATVCVRVTPSRPTCSAVTPAPPPRPGRPACSVYKRRHARPACSKRRHPVATAGVPQAHSVCASRSRVSRLQRTVSAVTQWQPRVCHRPTVCSRVSRLQRMHT